MLQLDEGIEVRKNSDVKSTRLDQCCFGLVFRKSTVLFDSAELRLQNPCCNHPRRAWHLGGEVTMAVRPFPRGRHLARSTPRRRSRSDGEYSNSRNSMIVRRIAAAAITVKAARAKGRADDDGPEARGPGL